MRGDRLADFAVDIEGVLVRLRREAALERLEVMKLVIPKMLAALHIHARPQRTERQVVQFLDDEHVAAAVGGVAKGSHGPLGFQTRRKEELAAHDNLLAGANGACATTRRCRRRACRADLALGGTRRARGLLAAKRGDDANGAASWPECDQVLSQRQRVPMHTPSAPQGL